MAAQEAAAPHDDGAADDRAHTELLGQLLRRTREQRGLSLKKFAAVSGISEGLLSQFERGKGNPTLLMLQKLADALSVPLSELFYRLSSTDGPAPGHTLSTDQCAVVDSGSRKRLEFPHEGLVYELLTPDLQRQLEMIRCEIPPGFDGSAKPFEHRGEESIHILEGRFQAHVADDVHDLGPGDTITLRSSLPHWWKNIGDVPVLVICAITPPSF